MKSKKLLLPTLILIAAIIAMIVFAALNNIAEKPTIPQKDFPFSITYELNGSTETVEGVYTARYTGVGGYVDSTARLYEGEITCRMEDVDGSFTLSQTEEGTIILYTNFYADYLLGDAGYDYFAYEPFAPTLVYYDHFDNNTYSDGQTLLQHGVRLISWEYPEPIENQFVFSHISYMTGGDVIPLTAIAAAALVAVLVFVKKEKDPSKKKAEIRCTVCNVLIAVIVVPVFLVFGIFVDIIGSSPDLGQQMLYWLPAITILGLAASVSLRRKGFRKGGFLVQFIGPAVFALLYLIETVGSLF